MIKIKADISDKSYFSFQNKIFKLKNAYNHEKEGTW